VSNAVNRAYKTLGSPMERIGYLLGRNGKEVGEGEAVEDAGLVAEVMEAREAIEGSTGAALARLKAGNDGKCDFFSCWSGADDCRQGESCVV
jgi:molecular chaperone HscB